MDDEKIIALYWDRNEQAISATADKYGSYCSSIARNILGNNEDTEECVNNTYLNAWNAIPPHRPDILSTFLGKITRNLAFNRYKHNTAHKRNYGEMPAVLDELAECVSGRENVEQEFDRQELIKALNDFLDALPKDKRNIFVCRYWYANSISDIAKQHGMKSSAVSMALNRLRIKLQNYLSERDFKL